MTGQAPKKIVITPEQSRLLGQVYQTILGWRRERLRQEAGAAGESEKPAQPDDSIPAKSEA